MNVQTNISFNINTQFEYFRSQRYWGTDGKRHDGIDFDGMGLSNYGDGVVKPVKGWAIQEWQAIFLRLDSYCCEKCCSTLENIDTINLINNNLSIAWKNINRIKIIKEK